MQANLYLYSSQKRPGLFCYCASPDSENLPESLSPWSAIGVLRGDQSPPRGLKRKDIESGVAKAGFQLWRKTGAALEK